MDLIDGNEIATEIVRELKEKVSTFEERPCVCFVRVGNDPASVSYVNKKKRLLQKSVSKVDYWFFLKIFLKTIF